jgi:hypothetical protein
VSTCTKGNEIVIAATKWVQQKKSWFDIERREKKMKNSVAAVAPTTRASVRLFDGFENSGLLLEEMRKKYSRMEERQNCDFYIDGHSLVLFRTLC